MTFVTNDKQNAIDYANSRAVAPIGKILRDYHVVDLGIRNPNVKHGARYAVVCGMDTRTIYTAKGVRKN